MQILLGLSLQTRFHFFLTQSVLYETWPVSSRFLYLWLLGTASSCAGNIPKSNAENSFCAIFSWPASIHLWRETKILCYETKQARN